MIFNTPIFDFTKSFGLNSDSSHWIQFLIYLFLSIFLIIIPFASLFSFLERKLSADLQARVGPSRVGCFGLLQPISDQLKLFQKSHKLGGLKKGVQGDVLWLWVHLMAFFISVIAIPLGSTVLLVDSDMSAFIPYLSALIFSLGTMLLGINQQSVSGWFGGIRLAAQTLSGSFPALIALLCAGIPTGSFFWSSFAQNQGFAPWSWNCFSNIFQLIAFTIFTTSGMVVLAISPLDGGLASSDIHNGVSSNLFGVKLSLFRFFRFYAFFLWSLVAVVFFLGAWSLPKSVVELSQKYHMQHLLALLELFWLLSKTCFLMLLTTWVGRVNPRSRVDQITDFSWRILSPLALVTLVGAGIWGHWSLL